MATDQLQDLIVRAKVKGYRTTRTGTGGWLVERVGSTTRRPKFAARYRLAGEQDLVRTTKKPSGLPPLAADHGSRVWGPPRR